MNILTFISSWLLLFSPVDYSAPTMTTFKTIILINGVPTVAEIQSSSRILSTYGQVPSYFTSSSSDEKIIQQVITAAVIYADTVESSTVMEDNLPIDDIINESVTDVARDMAIAYEAASKSMVINIKIEGIIANDMPISKLENLLHDFGVKREDIITTKVIKTDSERPIIKMSLVERSPASL